MKSQVNRLINELKVILSKRVTKSNMSRFTCVKINTKSLNNKIYDLSYQMWDYN